MSTKKKPASATKKSASAKKTKTAKPGAKTAGPPAPTSKDAAAFFGVTIKPEPSTRTVYAYRKALPGYANILDDAAEILGTIEGNLGLKGITPKLLLAAKAQRAYLVARETVLQKLYRTVYYQRLAVDDQAMGMLRKLARRVADSAEDDPDAVTAFQSIAAYLAKFAGRHSDDGGDGDEKHGTATADPTPPAPTK